MVYLDAGEDLQPMLDRVVPAGGAVMLAKTKIQGDARDVCSAAQPASTGRLSLATASGLRSR